MFREHGHTVALRFSSWSRLITPCEKVCRDRLGSEGWWPSNSQWYTYFGDRNGCNTSRPYWITFRNESDLTLVLLSANLTK
jgi:hypothetical protein